MKRIYTYIILTAGLLMSACQEYFIDSQPELPPTVYIDALDEYSVSAASPSRIVFNISANTPWNITTDSQWCMPDPAMSAASSLVAEIIVNTEDNESDTSRTATLTVTADELGIVKVIEVVQAKMKERIVLQLSDDPTSTSIIAGNGSAGETLIDFIANKPWTIVPSTLPEWLAVEKAADNQLKLTVSENNLLSERSTLLKLQAQGEEETAEFSFKVVQPARIKVAESAKLSVDAQTGYTKVEFTKGEMFRTDYLVTKGRFVIEFDDMKMSAICNLGFVFLGTTTDANFKFHMEGSNTYWFRCAGAFTWIAPIKKTYTFEEVNAIRKLEFVIEPVSEGLIDISIYINGTLYGTQAGRTDAFAAGEEGCVFILDTGLDPAAGDYCVIKSITYISE